MLAVRKSLHTGPTTPRVVVTGMGVVSPLGLNLQTSWDRLLNGLCGIKALKGAEFENVPCRIAGKIENLSKLLASKFTKDELKMMAPSTALALIAAEEALTQSLWTPRTEEDKDLTGVAVGVGMVDLNYICDVSQTLVNKKTLSNQFGRKISPYFVPRILPNMAAGHISIKNGFRGPNHSVSTACATGAHSIGDAFRFIKNGDAKVMVCGGAESCISPLSIAGFSRMRALALNFNDSPKTASRPFDQKRNGFIMGEGSAVLVLEELQHALDRRVDIYAEVLGYGLSGDASHITAPSEDGRGAILAMERALRSANLTPQDIGYINAHATSTPLGDAIEAGAIRKLFGDDVQVSSTKGSHGHLLGAAGNLESVFTIMAVHTGKLPPSINLESVDERMKLNYVANECQDWTHFSKDGRRIAIKNAFGFGGTNASLCFAQYK